MKTYEIRALFQFFDTDCSGTISKAGLHYLAR
jgi:Ca2+-binding EF-hand superfamily protein